MNMVEKKTPLASTSIWRSRCRCSGLVVFFRPNDWVTKRLARQALVAGKYDVDKYSGKKGILVR